MKRWLMMTALVLVASPAWADIPPPDTSSCRDAPVGKRCTLERGGGEGTCQHSTCGHNRLGPDHKVVYSSYDCMRCVAAGAGAADAGAAAPARDAGHSERPASGHFRELVALAFAGAFSLAVFFKRRRAS